MGSRKVQGYTLTELMIGLVLSAFLIGGVFSVYLSNQQTARTHRILSDMQQSAQISFQLFSHDLQHAGFSGCANMLSTRLVNVLNPVGGGQPWWLQWNGGIRGYESGAVPAFAAGVNAAAGTDGVQMMFGRGNSVSVVSHNVTGAPPLMVNQNSAVIRQGDILLGCDSKMAVIFQATAVAGNAISHAVGAGTPGNASLNFGFGANGVNFPQSINPDGGSVIPLESVGWYVGSDAVLYRVSLWNNSLQSEKVLKGVSNLQLKYLVAGAAAYVDATAVADWEAVVAAKVTLTLADPDGADVALGLRTLTMVVNLRNH